MSSKKNISKAALALALASAAVVTSQVEASQTTRETYLAHSGCAGGCGGGDNSPATPSKQNPRTDSGSNTNNSSNWTNQQKPMNNYGEPISYNNDLAKTPRTAQMNYGAEQDKYETARLENRTYPDNYNYNDKMNNGNNYNYQNAPGYSNTTYQQTKTERVAPGGTVTQSTTTTTTTLTESQLMSALNPQIKAVYQQLDSRGKALAIQIASQNSYADPNQAVLEAAHRTQSQQMSNMR